MPTRTEPSPSATVTEKASRSIVIAIAGSGGDGVALVGDLLLKMAAHQGLYGVLVQ
jgi:regulator of RNase E activity RraA